MFDSHKQVSRFFSLQKLLLLTKLLAFIFLILCILLLFTQKYNPFLLSRVNKEKLTRAKAIKFVNGVKFFTWFITLATSLVLIVVYIIIHRSTSVGDRIFWGSWPPDSTLEVKENVDILAKNDPPPRYHHPIQVWQEWHILAGTDHCWGI